MPINKVVYDGNALIDLSTDTLVSSEQLLKDIVAHGADGSVIIGSLEAGSGAKIVYEVVTFAEKTYNYTMTHNLGVVPTFAFAINDYSTKAAYLTMMVFQFVVEGTKFEYNSYYSHLSSSTIKGTPNSSNSKKGDISGGYLLGTGPDIGPADETTVAFGASENYFFGAGDKVLFVTGVM